MLHEDYSRSTVVQRMIAVGGCVLGGALIVLLSFIGSFGESKALTSSGFGATSLVFYLITIVAGLGIWARIPYALVVATVASAIDMVVFFTVQLSTTTWDASFYVLSKFVVIVCCLQLAMVVISFDDEPPRRIIKKTVDPNAPQPRRQVHRDPRRGR